MQKILLLDRSYTERGRRRMGFLLMKRTFDVLVSFCMLLVLLPLGLLVALICALDTKSSPIFSQERMGRGDKPFRIYKFRTMSPRTPADVATHQLVGAENYISRTGRVLRKLSLDELPQLWNILKGDMSFVGPRPVVLTETDLLRLRSRNGASSVRPGLTGLAQVSGRDCVTVPEKARLDGQYARCQSAALDCRILLKTVGYVLHSSGVVEGANPAITHCKKERSA